MGIQPHIVVVPLPAQGHVKPLLHLSQRLVDHGIKVTFLNTEFIHAKLTAGMSQKEIQESRITLASIPDGLETENDRKDPVKFPVTFKRVAPAHFINLIQEINKSTDVPPVNCVIADITIGWILDVGKSIGLKGIAFMPMSAANLALISIISNLIQAGNIDTNGITKKEEEISVSKGIPPWRSDRLTWSFPLDINCHMSSFQICVTMKEASDQADWLLCNTMYELEQSACNLIPNILPIGPLHGDMEEKHSTTTGSFWEEDTSCLSWLNKQEPGSVIYVSFGSFAVMSQTQFNELALGLQQSGKPFLWIVRADIIYGFPPEYPNGFLENVADQGKIVQWVPQNKVLSHPAIACFFTHCGWNSTLEGLSAGLPFLCWPFFADQFHNADFVCDARKVGLKLLNSDETLISSAEICMKIGKLLSDGYIKGNAIKIKSLLQKSFSKEGSSFQNMEKFINHLKAKA